ncbi:acyltransferase [Staphylococcus equorum]|uniref:acyltransferase n=1 Tax=Staphylococcus equorum TaxID=246432 RepID=UPI002DB5CB91|nr:acyltransferase [Staphylococcus equorum]MEB7722865.1 acyltransferase [Staphylococcus equorum]
MSGRDAFKKFKIIIKLCEVLLELIPNFILYILYDISSNFENKVAILFRFLFLKKFSKKCGENVFIGSRVVLKNINELSLGNNISIHSGSYIDASGHITIEDDVSIAAHVCLYSFNHTWANTQLPIKYNPVEYGEIVIKNDVWIGTKSVVLAGVHVNRRSVIAAGSVVNKNVQENTLVAGTPAKIIKKITKENLL